MFRRRRSQHVLLVGVVLFGALSSFGEALATAESVDRLEVTRRVIGLSVEGRDIEAFRLGTPGGTPVLVVGVIHGDEDAGLLITDRLMAMTPPKGVELWVVPTMNPDGTASQTRGNANKVD
ncbi:MAG: M14 family zinc carboxypeptidase, partial [Ilumatobacteraceae bacterium]